MTERSHDRRRSRRPRRWPRPAAASAGTKQFVASAHENGDGTVTLPLHTASVGGDHVYYVIFDTSSGSRAKQLGVNRSQKLAQRGRLGRHAAGLDGRRRQRPLRGHRRLHARPRRVGAERVPAGRRRARLASPTPATRRWSSGPTAPSTTRRRSPATRTATASSAPDELHDKVVSIDIANHTVTLLETDGFQGGKPVHYVSTDSSVGLAAALEGATLVPRLNNAPGLGDDSTKSSRASLGAFVNGQTGVGNPNRQGFESAVRGEGSPLNVLRWRPNQGRYSPLWDVHIGLWSAAAVAAGREHPADELQRHRGPGEEAHRDQPGRLAVPARPASSSTARSSRRAESSLPGAGRRRRPPG